MAEVLDRGRLRQRIDALELAEKLQAAIDDIQGVEWGTEARAVNVHITDPATRYVGYVYDIPPELLIEGLRYMQQRCMS
jgi:hypothetical protein